MLRIVKLAGLLIVCATAVSASPLPPIPLLREDFHAYPPGSPETVPEGFVTVRGTSLVNDTQEFNYDLWESYGIVRWAIRRLSAWNTRRLVYIGNGETDPSQWSDYTAYTQFEIPTSPGSCKVHLLGRLQGNSTNQQGYTAIWNGSATGDELPYRLVIYKDYFDRSMTNLLDPNLIAYSTNTFEITSNTVYTIKFALQGEKLSAAFYEGTNLALPDALKMTASGTDASYTSGTAGFGLRVPNTNVFGYFYNLFVDAPPPRGTVVILR